MWLVRARQLRPDSVAGFRERPDPSAFHVKEDKLFVPSAEPFLKGDLVPRVPPRLDWMGSVSAQTLPKGNLIQRLQGRSGWSMQLLGKVIQC